MNWKKMEDKSSTGQKFDFFGNSNFCPLELMSWSLFICFVRPELQAWGSWFNQEVLCSTRNFLSFPRTFCFLPESFVVIGQFFTIRKEPLVFFIEWSSPYLGSCFIHVDHILPTTPSQFKGKYNFRLLGKGSKNGSSMIGGLDWFPSYGI